MLFACEEVEEQLRLARLNGPAVARVGDRYLEVSGSNLRWALTAHLF